MKKNELTLTSLNSSSLFEIWSKGHRSDHKRSTDFLAKWARKILLDSAPAPRFQIDNEPPLMRAVSNDQHQELLQRVEAELAKPLRISGENRQPDWETGWAQNLERYLESKNDLELVPGYFEKSRWIRLSDRFYKVQNPLTEFLALSCLVDFIIKELSASWTFSRINEFGCGTGVHAQRLATLSDEINVTGYDWAQASQEIIQAVAGAKNLGNLRGQRFDFFHPDNDVDLGEGDLVLTIAALEQTGSRFHAFLDFLIKKRPEIVVNIEPISELLDTASEMGRLSVEYFKKRNYLSGYFDKLVKLESVGAVEILHAGRSGIGSLFIEGYSVVIWRPC